MDNHELTALEILKKHEELKPKVSIILSVSEDNNLTLDVSHPAEIGTLSVMAKFCQLHLDGLLKERMGLK